MGWIPVGDSDLFFHFATELKFTIFLYLSMLTYCVDILHFCRVRMISLAAQKFVSDIANDALQHCKMRGSGQSSRKSGKVCSGLSLIF